MIRCFLILLCLAPGLPAMAQPGGITVRHYSTENGLPSNGIQGMQWDEANRFLWLATEAGFVRFNGAEMKSFSRQNTPFIESERTSFFIRNLQGKMLGSDMRGNLLQVAGNRLEPYPFSMSRERNNWGQYRLLMASDSLYTAGFRWFSKMRPYLLIAHLVPLSDTSCLLLQQPGLFHFTAGQDEPVEMPAGRELKKIFVAGDAVYGLNQRGQAFRIGNNGATVEPVTVLQNGNRQPLLLNPSRLFWESGMPAPLYLEDGICRSLEKTKEGLLATTLFRGIEVDALVRHLQYSPALQLLFLGTESKGLYIVQPQQVQVYKADRKKQQVRNSHYAQVVLPGGNVLTNEGVELGPFPPGTPTLPISGKFIFSTQLSGDSLLWFAQQSGKNDIVCLNQYNKRTGRHTAFPHIRIREQYGLVTTAAGTFLANEQGLARLEGDSLRFLFRHRGSSSDLLTYELLESAPGELVLAGCFGLLRYRLATGQLDTLYNKETYCVRSIRKLGDYLFIGTYGDGYYIWKDGVLRSMPADKNRYLLYTHCFMPDSNGYVWMSTNRGLFKARLADITTAFETGGDVVYYHYFGKNDGMQTTELNGGCTPCAVRVPDGRFSFPSMDGLVWIHPEQAQPILPEGDIWIDEWEVEEQRYLLTGDSIPVLPAGTRGLTLRLAVPAWAHPENLYLEYRLQDTAAWRLVRVEQGMKLQLGNLSYGRHRVQLRKRNGFGSGNFSYLSFTFRIRTPWYLQWWFVLLAVMGTGGLITGAVYLRIRQLRRIQYRLETLVAQKTQELQRQNTLLEKNDTIKTRLISIISHDIVTPLKFVAAAGRKLVANKAQMSESLQQETIREMTHTAQDLQLLSTNILNWIKYQNKNRRMVQEPVQVKALVDQIMGVLQIMAREKGLELCNETDPALELVQFAEPLRILVYNLLSNAISFSDRGTITVFSTRNEQLVRLHVRDEGIGMMPEQVQNLLSEDYVVVSPGSDQRRGNGLGYLIIKDLLQLMQVGMEIQSEKGKGTEVTLLFLRKQPEETPA